VIKIPKVKTIRTLAKTNNNYKFWQICEKEFENNGETKTYIAFESGKVMRAEDGQLAFEFPPNRISLPKDEELLKPLVTVLDTMVKGKKK
jgi:hypothetical protein